MAFNEEFITAVAHGDVEAIAEVNKLPLPVRVNIGIEVDKMRMERGIVPISTGFSVYEKQKSKHVSDEEVLKSIREERARERAESERQEKAREEHMRKVIEYKVKRARAGLTY